MTLHTPAVKLTTIDALSGFIFDRVLNEDPLAHSLTLLGTFTLTGDEPNEGQDQRATAIIRLVKSAFDSSSPQIRQLFGHRGTIKRIQLEQATDIYTWLYGWFGEERPNDLKIDIICPATETHIRKYSSQDKFIVRETPELYTQIVRPYIEAFPASRTQWVESILLGLSESSKILYKTPHSPFPSPPALAAAAAAAESPGSHEAGFLILPDAKWDLKTMSSLYLLALVYDRSLRSMRDLRKHRHLDMLREIRRASYAILKERGWDQQVKSLRLYVHYQPSYYHFHVHIVNANMEGSLGMAAGQAHLLDELISLLELDADDPAPGTSIFERITLTYQLGDQHALCAPMREAQASLSD